MEWQSWIWRLSGNRRVRKSLVGSVSLLIVWSVAWGPLIEWRQQMLLDRMQPFIDGMTDTASPPPSESDPSPSPRPRPSR